MQMTEKGRSGEKEKKIEMEREGARERKGEQGGEERKEDRVGREMENGETELDRKMAKGTEKKVHTERYTEKRGEKNYQRHSFLTRNV